MCELGKGVFLVEVKRINVPKGTSGLSFRNVRSGSGQSAQGARASQRMQQTTADQNQNLAYQINFAPRSFFFEDDFNDISIEELAMYMERDENFVEQVDEEEPKEQAQSQQQAPPEPEAPVDKRKVAAVAAYDWFATL